MKKILTAAAIGAFAFAATPVLALDTGKDTATQPEQPAIEQPATSTEQTGSIDRVTLVAGENSFTENQAQDRIKNAGFTNVSGLTMDDQGIWRGTASKGAQTVNVGLDFKGNVAADAKSTQ